MVKFQNVVPLLKQLEYFQEYRKRLEDAIGKEKTDDLIRRAVFLVSAGTNDFALNYFTARLRRLNFSIPDYEKFVLQHEREFIQVKLINQTTTRQPLLEHKPKEKNRTDMKQDRIGTRTSTTV